MSTGLSHIVVFGYISVFRRNILRPYLDLKASNNAQDNGVNFPCYPIRVRRIKM
jgi:hypothetical protein